ncbi:MAG: fatty acid desaturase family protein [Pseudohongiellaceae bacterium]
MIIRDHFSQSELKEFSARSDFHGWLAVVSNWGIICAAFALVAFAANPLTLVLALILLGGRHLGLGVLMHECGHGTLFKTKRLNRFVGKWLCAAPVNYRLDDYMKNHLSHHRKAGSEADPDLHRYRGYPVSKYSLRRKLLRDLSGRTTLSFLKNSLAKNRVFSEGENGDRRFNLSQFLIQFHAPLIMNLVLLGFLTAAGFPEFYLLWLLAYFSIYMVFSRIRNLAEHACVPDLFDPNPLMHTRTTHAAWWERLTFAPNCVNYHLEHHLLPSVPKYRLAAFHRALQRKGLLDNADIESGYFPFMRRLVSSEEQRESL